MIALLPESFGLIGLVAILLGVLAVVGLLMRATSKGGRTVREGRVLGIIGRKGAGKSLLATHELLRSIGVRQVCQKCTKDHGEKIVHRGHVATNGSLKVNERQAEYVHIVKGWWDIVGERPREEWGPKGEDRYYFKLPHKTLILLDEFDLWLPAKQGETVPEHVRWYLKQCRKGIQEVMWIAQHESRVALGARLLTDELGHVTRGLFGGKKVEFYEVENYRKPGRKPDWTFRYRVTSKIANAYDTYELLMPDDDPELARDVARSGRGGSSAPRSLHAGKLSPVTPSENNTTPVGSIQVSRPDPTGVAAHDSTHVA